MVTRIWQAFASFHATCMERKATRTVHLSYNTSIVMFWSWLENGRVWICKPYECWQYYIRAQDNRRCASSNSSHRQTVSRYSSAATHPPQYKLLRAHRAYHEPKAAAKPVTSALRRQVNRYRVEVGFVILTNKSRSEVKSAEGSRRTRRNPHSMSG